MNKIIARIVQRFTLPLLALTQLVLLGLPTSASAQTVDGVVYSPPLYYSSLHTGRDGQTFLSDIIYGFPDADSAADDALTRASGYWPGTITTPRPPGCNDNIRMEQTTGPIRYARQYGCPGYLYGDPLAVSGPYCADKNASLSFKGTDLYPVCVSFTYATNCIDCPVGNPVQLATGAKVHTAEDYASAGAHPISFTRYYSSRPAWPYDSPGQTVPGPWSHNWSQFVDATYALPNTNGGIGGVIYAVSADRMKVGIYRRQANGTYVADAPVKDVFTIVKNASNVVTGYTIKRFEDDATEHYSTNGKLQKIVARNGWTYTLTYSTSTTPVTEYQLGSSTSNPPAPGLLMSVTNQFGRKIRLVYTVRPPTESGTVKATLNQLLPPGAIKDSGSGSATSPIFYQSRTQVIWQDGNKVQYKFDNAAVPDAMTSIVDEANNTIGIYKYDGTGRVIEESAGDGSNRRTFSYGTVSPYETRNTMTDYSTGAAKSVTHILIPNKGVWVQSYTNQRCVECGDPISYTDYDDQLRKKSTRTWDGVATFYTYDAKGRITEQATFPASVPQTLTRPALNLATSVITTQWHATFNLATKIAEPGKITAQTYDAKGNLTGYSEVQTSDTTGALGMSAAQAVGTAIKSVGWSFNNSNLPITIVERETPANSTTAVEINKWTVTYTVSSDQNVVKNVTTNNTGTYTTYGPSGNPLTFTSTNNGSKRWIYNLRGKLQEFSSNGNTVRIAYNASAALVSFAWDTQLPVSLDNPPSGLLAKGTAKQSYLLGRQKIIAVGPMTPDAQKLSDTMQKCINDLDTANVRSDLKLFGISINNSIPGNFDCWEQTEHIINCISPLKLNNNWVYAIQEGYGHYWGVAVSSDPNDPKIWFDGRANQISVGARCESCNGWFAGIKDKLPYFEPPRPAPKRPRYAK